MRETALKSKVLKMLHAEYPEIWTYKSCDRFTAGIPDIIGCLPGGRMFAVELKIKPNKATRLQDHVLGRIKRAGGIAGVCYSVDEVRNLIAGCEGSVVCSENQ